MWRHLENKVRKIVGATEKHPTYFAYHAVSTESLDGSITHRYQIPGVVAAGDFMVSCWEDVGDQHRSVNDALEDYMWARRIDARRVILKKGSWVGEFTIDANTYITTTFVMEV